MMMMMMMMMKKMMMMIHNDNDDNGDDDDDDDACAATITGAQHKMLRHVFAISSVLDPQQRALQRDIKQTAPKHESERHRSGKERGAAVKLPIVTQSSS